MAEDDFIEDWLNQEVSPSEKEGMESVIAMTESMAVPSKLSKEDAWDSLFSKLDGASEGKERVLVPNTHRRRNWAIVITSIAAALLVGVFIFKPDNSQVVVSVGLAQTETVTLPDNSVVTLNANSALSYDKGSWPDNRSLNLSGEGYFKVEPGSTFRVNTDKGVVMVVGTAFNIKNRGDILEVSCFEGKVSVSSLSNKKAVLEAGMQTTINQNPNHLEIEPFAPAQTATWRIGEFYFDEVSLTTAVEELQRQFNITIDVLTDIGYRSYSGYFSNQNLIEALQLVFTPMGLKFEINGDKVTVQ